MAEIRTEMSQYIEVTVCHAVDSHNVVRKKVVLEAGACVLDALKMTGYDQLDWSHYGLGIYGKRKSPDSTLHQGDRVEIYLPLTADPKIARQRRVDKQRREKPDRWIRR